MQMTQHWLPALDPEDMQEIVDLFSAAATDFGLKINVATTELLYQPPPDERTADAQLSILVNGVVLKTTESFTYLGSAVTTTNSLGPGVVAWLCSGCRHFHTL